MTVPIARTPRNCLARELHQRGFEIANPVGNWILAKIGPGVRKLAGEMKQRGILVQVPANPDLAGWLRISTPNLSAVVAFLQAFDGILAGAIVTEGWSLSAPGGLFAEVPK